MLVVLEYVLKVPTDVLSSLCGPKKLPLKLEIHLDFQGCAWSTRTSAASHPNIRAERLNAQCMALVD